MSVSPGSILAHYRITAVLGAGGMGEVWRAEDTKLGREVAIKLLPEDFANDPDRHARFEREAKVLASLNHANIATLFGLEHLGGQHALVMELVEGEGLDDVIARGPVPVDEAMSMALQIAEALEAAHEAGIVHRDLKPANIRIRLDGAVKVLDFGLAKEWETESRDSGLSNSPTITKHATAAGVILGTAAYMSPEQARGKPVDRRTDIWAFGVVLWEMLTSRTLFAGDTVSDVLASVLKEKPDVDALPSNVPEALKGLLRRCLEQDPRRRLRDIGEARIFLEEFASGVQSPAGHPVDGPVDVVTRRPDLLMRVLPWAIAAAAVVTTATVWIAGPQPDPRPPKLVASILSPENGGFDVGRGMALSPDGTQIVFPALRDDGRRNLWVRNLGDGKSRMLDGTNDGQAPFWSPEGRSIAFIAEGALKRIELAKGVIETISDARFAFGGSWSNQGPLVLGGSWVTRLRVISPTGKEEDPPEGEQTSGSELLMWPSFLPDGNHFIYLARRYASEEQTGEIRLSSLDDPSERVLLRSNSNALYAEPGYLLWWREGNLRAQRFDLDQLELVGESTALISGVRFNSGSGHMAVTVSNNGLLVYQKGGDLEDDELVILDREGRQIALVAPQGSYYGPRLSPDGRRAVSDVSDASNNGDLWVYDLSRGTGTRLTSLPEDETRPRWSSDGERIVFSSMAGKEQMTLWVCEVGNGGEPQPLFGESNSHLRVTDWSSTGLVLLDRADGRQYDIYFFSPEHDQLQPWVATPFNERTATASPGGEFAAYVSENSGRAEVWVRSFPQGDRAWRVSIDGGDWPCWRNDGNELYFQASNGWLMAIPVRWKTTESGREPIFGEPQQLFRFESKKHFDRQYDTIDGESFLVNRSVRTGVDTPLTLVQGWFEEATDR